MNRVFGQQNSKRSVERTAKARRIQRYDVSSLFIVCQYHGFNSVAVADQEWARQDSSQQQCGGRSCSESACLLTMAHKNEALVISCCVQLKTVPEGERQHADLRRADILTCDDSWDVRRKGAAYRQAGGDIGSYITCLRGCTSKGFH